MVAGRKAHVNADPSAMEVCAESGRTGTDGLLSPVASSERALLPSALGHPCASPTAAAANERTTPQWRTSQRLQSKRSRKKVRTSPAL